MGSKLIEFYYNNDRNIMVIFENHPALKKIAKKVLEALVPAMEMYLK